MNIMEVVSGTTVNGAILHCLMLTRQLLRRGHEVTLVSRPGAWIADQLRSDPIEIVYSDQHRFPTDELRRIAAVVRRKQIEVVHTHTSRSHFFGVLLRWYAGVPSVATAHHRHFQLHWMFNDLVIAVSEATRRYHRRWNLVPARRLETIHNFVDPRILASQPSGQRESVQAEFRLDPAWPLIGTIGNVIPRKGILHLIRALPRVLRTAPETRLAIIGSPGPARYMDQLQTTAEQLDVASRIVWTGPRQDVPRLMAGLDVCVLASIEESLPLVLLEAMAAGLPVVATAVGGVPECVHHDETGLLVPPADSRALGDALAALLLDPARRRRLAEQGCRFVREHFSPEGQTARVEAALARVARRAA